MARIDPLEIPSREGCKKRVTSHSPKELRGWLYRQQESRTGPPPSRGEIHRKYTCHWPGSPGWNRAESGRPAIPNHRADSLKRSTRMTVEPGK